jgi:hypothetical protein
MSRSKANDIAERKRFKPWTKPLALKMGKVPEIRLIKKSEWMSGERFCLGKIRKKPNRKNRL